MNIKIKLDPQIRLLVLRDDSRDDGGFGKGTAALLRGVDRTGSLSLAAKELGMAYSKAWRIVKETEANFSVQFLIRDGARGSSLTPEGHEFLKNYDEITQATQELADRMFAERFNVHP